MHCNLFLIAVHIIILKINMNTLQKDYLLSIHDKNHVLDIQEVDSQEFVHLFSDEARIIYNNRLSNTVIEVVESFEGYHKRNAYIIQYYQLMIEDANPANVSKGIEKAAKLFNRLVGEGLLDFGVFCPISRMKLHSINNENRELIFLFVCPSKYLSMKIYEMTKEENITPVQALNIIAKTNDFYDEGKEM